jgi:peptide/nickel transport system substrate-binding protein
MELTWQLRPDIRWHDGTPATASDFTFGAEITQDRDLPLRRGEPATLITEVVAPEPHTLVVRWKGLYPEANYSGPTDIPAVPAHLLNDLYRSGDKQAFTNSRYWTNEFIGVGPYRLGDWALGSHLEALAFDRYFLGRPKIDRIVFSYFSDVNALYTSHLAAEVDMTPFGSFQALHFVPLKKEWEPSGAGTALSVFSGSRNYRFQFGYPEAPWMDRRVRRAFVHMIDRHDLTDALLAGFSTPADTVVSPGDPIYRLVEQRGLAKYPFDLAQAQRLMTEAGWNRGQDGMYRSASGQPISVELRVGNPPLVREASAIGGYLKTAGVDSTIAVGTDGEIRFTFTGLQGGPLRDTHQDLAAFVTTQIGTEANRWTGSNRGRYTNPTYDSIYNQSLITLNTSEREGMIADLLKIEAEDVASIHLFHDMAQQTIVFRKGVRGPAPVSSKQLIVAWNVHTWEVD